MLDGRIKLISLKSLSADDRLYVASQVKSAGSATAGSRILASLSALGQMNSALSSSGAPPDIPPNAIYVRLSKPLLNRYVGHRVFKRAAVSDCILGTPVQGTSDTTGRTELRLIPDERRARFVVQLTGTAESTTVGQHDPVSIFTRCWTDFRSTKQVAIENGRIVPSPAQTRARSRSTTTNITTDLGPILSRIVLRSAWQQVNESRAEADQIAANHTAQRIDRELDRAVDESASRLRTGLAQLEQGLQRHRLKRPKMFATTTDDYLQIVLLRDDADRADIARFITPPTADGCPTGHRSGRTLLGGVGGCAGRRTARRAGASADISLVSESREVCFGSAVAGDRQSIVRRGMEVDRRRPVAPNRLDSADGQGQTGRRRAVGGDALTVRGPS